MDYSDDEASEAFNYQVDNLNRKSSTFKLSVLTARLDADDSYAVGSACMSRSTSLFPALVSMGGSRRGAQGARAPSKPMAGRSGLIDSVLLALPVRFQNALKHA